MLHLKKKNQINNFPVQTFLLHMNWAWLVVTQDKNKKEDED